MVAGLVGAFIWWNPVGQRKAPVSSGGGSAVVATTDAGPAPMMADAVPTVVDDAAVAPEVELDAVAETPLYTVTEALEDIGADPLEFIGTGEWFGNFSIHACAYRNKRVIVVNVYCTFKEQPAIGVAVLSPARGRVYFYAEGESAISKLKRGKYITFRAEVQPPIERDPLELTFTYPQLLAWEERRYNARAGACWNDGGHSDCSDGLSSQLPAWAESAKPFIGDPPASWYTLAKDLHQRAQRDLRKK